MPFFYDINIALKRNKGKKYIVLSKPKGGY